MIGMAQFLGYIISTYICYRGLTDAIKAEGKGKAALIVFGIILILATLVLVGQMDNFALSVSNH